jgi:hypothetical protein
LEGEAHEQNLLNSNGFRAHQSQTKAAELEPEAGDCSELDLRFNYKLFHKFCGVDGLVVGIGIALTVFVTQFMIPVK